MAERLLLPDDPAYKQVIEGVAQEIYAGFSYYYGDGAHRAGLCGDITELMQRDLGRRGIPLMRHYVPGPGHWRYHYYLRDEAGPDMIIDPTWQYFAK